MDKPHVNTLSLSRLVMLGGLAIIYYYYLSRAQSHKGANPRSYSVFRNFNSLVNYNRHISSEEDFDQARADLNMIWQELRKALQERFPERPIRPQDKISSFFTPGGTSGNYGFFASIINETPSLFSYMGNRNINPGHIDHCDTLGCLSRSIRNRKA